MTTFLTKSDRQFLKDELEECLSDMAHTPQEIRQIIGDLHEMPNSVFYQSMVDWMPDCMDNLRYYKECQLRMAQR